MRRAIVTSCCVAALALAGCGGGSSPDKATPVKTTTTIALASGKTPPQVLASAVQATLETKRARATTTQVADGDDKLKDFRAKTTNTLEFFGDSIGTSRVRGTLAAPSTTIDGAYEFRSVGNTAYVKIPAAFRTEHDIDTPWVSFQTEKPTANREAVILALLSTADDVEARGAVLAGTMHIDKVDYRLPNFVWKASAGLDVISIMDSLVDQFGLTPRFVATVDDSLHIVRLELRSDEGIHMSEVLELSGFGNPVEVNAPPAELVTPAPKDLPTPV